MDSSKGKAENLTQHSLLSSWSFACSLWDALWKTPGSNLAPLLLPLTVNAIETLEALAGTAACTSPLSPETLRTVAYTETVLHIWRLSGHSRSSPPLEQIAHPS